METFDVYIVVDSVRLCIHHSGMLVVMIPGNVELAVTMLVSAFDNLGSSMVMNMP